MVDFKPPNDTLRVKRFDKQGCRQKLVIQHKKNSNTKMKKTRERRTIVWTQKIRSMRGDVKIKLSDSKTHGLIVFWFECI